MGQYVLTRWWQALVVAAGVSLIVFLFLHLSGDPVLLMVSSDAPAETVERLRHELGFDRPLWEQYLRFVGGVARGDFGNSLRMNQPALGLVFERLLVTVGFTGTLVVAGCNTSLQLAAPDPLRGRIMSLYTLLSGGIFPVSALFVGALSEAAGVSRAFALNGALGLIALALLMSAHRRRS